jgi:predicted nucleic acid-binding protein
LKYLLDTNVLSEIVRKHPNRALLQRLKEAVASDVVTSAMCVAELRHGAARREDGGRLWERIEREILTNLEILPLGEAEAVRAGDLLAFLEEQGKPIGIEDVWIGATALEHGLTVITRNLKHFQRIPDLRAESWWQVGTESEN